jgi:hypothetical protein
VALFLAIREGWSLGLRDLFITVKTWWVLRGRFGDFDGFVERILDQSNVDRLDSILYVLTNLQFDSTKLKIPSWSYVHGLAYQLKREQMKWARRNLEALVWNVNLLNAILREFGELYVNVAIDQILELGFSRVQGNYRHMLVNGRDKYIRLLDDWEGFIDGTNRTLPTPSLRKQSIERPKALT